LFGRIKDLIWMAGGSSSSSSSSSSPEDVLERIKHGYDRVGNRNYRMNLADPNRLHDEYYWYDGVDRLNDMERGTLNSANTGIEMLAFAQCWRLDATGNWIGFREDDMGDGVWDFVQERTCNSVNEISVVNSFAGPAWITPTYDAAGNMTLIPQSASPTTGFTAKYDAWNRLVQLSAGGITVAQYEYDGMKRRIVLNMYSGGVLSKTLHHFYTALWQVIEERIGTFTCANRHFVWGKRYVDDLVLRDRDTTGSGTLNERLYGMQDANWNVTAVADSNGSVQERYAFTPFGTATYLTSTFGTRAASSYGWETLYAGYRLDFATSIYYVRNRYFAAHLAGWLTRDPFGYVDSLNLYLYAGSNPVNGSDPSGAYLIVAVLIVGAIAVAGTLAYTSYQAAQTGEPGAIFGAGAEGLGEGASNAGVGACRCVNDMVFVPVDFAGTSADAASIYFGGESLGYQPSSYYAAGTESALQAGTPWYEISGQTALSTGRTMATCGAYDVYDAVDYYNTTGDSAGMSQRLGGVATGNLMAAGGARMIPGRGAIGVRFLPARQSSQGFFCTVYYGSARRGQPISWYHWTSTRGQTPVAPGSRVFGSTPHFWLEIPVLRPGNIGAFGTSGQQGRVPIGPTNCLTSGVFGNSQAVPYPPLRPLTLQPE